MTGTEERPERVEQRARVHRGGQSTQVAGDLVHVHGDLVVALAGGDPPGRVLSDRARPVPEWTAQRLDVHPAISGRPARSGGRPGFVLPRYVPRQHDRLLRTLLANCARSTSGTLVLVRGRSCTGKTRSAYEAVHAMLPDWQLLFPAGPDGLLAAMAPGALAPRTVLWLNEAQHYLTGPLGEEAAVALRRRLDDDGPFLAVATVREDFAGDLLDPAGAGNDPHQHARILLRQAHAVALPDSFAEDLSAVRDAAAADDPAWEAALSVGSTALTQTLAAAPDLVDRYAHPTGRHGPYGRALISAAMDAHRLGVSSPLPLAFLKAAAPGYLTDAQRAAADPGTWFTTALAYARTLVNGVTSPLQAVARPCGMGPEPDVVGLADYLQQHGRLTRSLLCPPASFWDATAHLTSRHDLAALAKAAENRIRYRYAVPLYQRTVDDGQLSSLAALAEMHQMMGDAAEAERLALEAARAGYPSLRRRLALEREKIRDTAEAERLHQAGVNAGNPGALADLTLLREEAGQREEAERLAHQAAKAGQPAPLVHLAFMREAAGETQEAERLFLAADAAGSIIALSQLARLRVKAGDQESAEQLLCGVARNHAARGRALRNCIACGALVQLWEESGRQEEAERLALEAARSGESLPLWKLAETRERAGDVQEAERLYQIGVDAGHSGSGERLARLRGGADARQLLRYGMEADGSLSAPWKPVARLPGRRRGRG